MQLALTEPDTEIYATCSSPTCPSWSARLPGPSGTRSGMPSFNGRSSSSGYSSSSAPLRPNRWWH